MDTLILALILAAEMAWTTWWALVLGFTIAGAVESFISEERMTTALGGQGMKPVVLGTLFGAASSSCSFGAVATTKSLFKKRASPQASLGAFQFASTNGRCHHPLPLAVHRLGSGTGMAWRYSTFWLYRLPEQLVYDVIFTSDAYKP